jgi:hypothetical protein
MAIHAVSSQADTPGAARLTKDLVKLLQSLVYAFALNYHILNRDVQTEMDHTSSTLTEMLTKVHALLQCACRNEPL